VAESRYNVVVEFRILGPLAGVADSGPVGLGPHKQRALLGILLLHTNEVVSVSRLIEAIWGGRPPPTAAKLVQVYVSQLRRILEQEGAEGVLTTRPPGYVATVAPDRLDAERFTRFLTEARARAQMGPLAEAAALYDEALALWRGPVLADIKLEGSVLSAAERLRELRLAALSERADCELARGRHAQLVPELEQLTGEHPLHERFWAHLMLALYRSGRQSEALAAYQRARRVLAEEVGLSPSSELQQLERAMLTHDSSLELDAKAEPPAGVEPPARPPSRHRRNAVALLLLGLAAAAAAITLTRGSAFTPLTKLAPNSIGIIDPAKNALAGQIRLATRPAAIAVGGGSLWVAMQDDETLLRLDPRRHRVLQTIGLGAIPTAVTTGGRYVWVLCGYAKTVVEVDTHTSTLMRTVVLAGKITVHGFEDSPLLEIAAGANAAWVAAGPGLVIRIDANTGRLEHVGTGFGSVVAVGGGAVWTVGSTSNWGGTGEVSRIDPGTRTVTETVRAPSLVLAEYAVDAVADDGGVWVVDETSWSVWKVDPVVARVIAVLRIHGPLDAAIGEGALWTANDDGTVSRIDPVAAMLTRTIPLGKYPRVAFPVSLAVGEGAVWVAVH
jgi:DNA-binding SARP family transcriptional activator/DNA-binding beta-propeller fold protein YncE